MVTGAVAGNISAEATTPTGNIFAEAMRGEAIICPKCRTQVGSFIEKAQDVVTQKHITYDPDPITTLDPDSHYKILCGNPKCSEHSKAVVIEVISGDDAPKTESRLKVYTRGGWIG
jgi:hypothetical protein